MKVELQEKFNTSLGQVIVFKADEVVKVGDKIEAGDEKYTVKRFITPSGSFDADLISAVVK